MTVALPFSATAAQFLVRIGDCLALSKRPLFDLITRIEYN